MPTPIFSPEITNPPSSWADADKWEFMTFVSHFQDWRCSNCGGIDHMCETFRAFIQKNSSIDPGRRLLPAANVPHGVQVVRFRLPEKSIPLCYRCIDSRTEDGTVFLVADESVWAAALERSRQEWLIMQKNKRDKLDAALRRTPKTPISLDDIPG